MILLLSTLLSTEASEAYGPVYVDRFIVIVDQISLCRALHLEWPQCKGSTETSTKIIYLFTCYKGVQNATYSLFI